MFFFLVMVLSLLSVYGEEHMVGLCMNNFCWGVGVDFFFLGFAWHEFYGWSKPWEFFGSWSSIEVCRWRYNITFKLRPIKVVIFGRLPIFFCPYKYWNIQNSSLQIFWSFFVLTKSKFVIFWLGHRFGKSKLTCFVTVLIVDFLTAHILCDENQGGN